MLCKPATLAAFRAAAMAFLLVVHAHAPAIADEITTERGTKIALPPVEQFLEGDVWDAYDRQASTQNTDVRIEVVRKNGKWSLEGSGLERYLKRGSPGSREFLELRPGPVRYPSNPADGTYYATPDGVLHRFTAGAWAVVPIGSVVTMPKGGSTTITHRMTHNEADILTASTQPEFKGPLPASEQTVIVPLLNQQIPGARVGWSADDVGSAIKRAQVDGKPMVMLVITANCGYCRALLSNALRCPTFNTLAGQAHFVLVSDTEPPGSDARKLVDALRIVSFPATSIIRAKGNDIDEASRVTGYLDERELLVHLAKAGLKPAGANPQPLSTVALGTFVPHGCLPGGSSPQDLERPPSGTILKSKP